MSQQMARLNELLEDDAVVDLSAFKKTNEKYYQNRRSSVLPETASTRVDISEAWEIKTVEQLAAMVKKKPDEVLMMLNELRSNNDEAIMCIRVNNSIVDRCASAESDVKKNENDIASLQEELRKEKEVGSSNDTLVQTLEGTIRELQNEVEQVRIDLTAARRATSIDTTSTVTGKRSVKMPDPEPFLGRHKGPEFETWRLSIMDKLTGNADHFPTPQLAAVYVLNRTGDDAAGYLASFRYKDPQFFKSSEMVLETMTRHYRDPNRIALSENKYYHLKQGDTEPFLDFYEKMQLEGRVQGLDDERMRVDLHHKVNNFLRTRYATSADTLSTLQATRTYYETIDVRSRLQREEKKAEIARGNELAAKANAAAASRPKTTSAGTTPGILTPRTGATTPVVTTTIRPSRLAASDPRLALLTKEGKCFNCGEKGHISKECPHEDKKDQRYIHTRVQEMELQTAGSENA